MGFESFVKSVLEGLPVLIALGAGCALALLSLAKCRRPALLALLAGALALLHFFGARVFSAFVVPQLYARSGSNVAGFARSGSSLFLNLVLAAALGLLFYAVFDGRAEAKKGA